MRLALAFALLVAAVNVAAAAGYSVGGFDQHVQAHHVRACTVPVSGVTWTPLKAVQHFRSVSGRPCVIVARYAVQTAATATETPPSPSPVPPSPVPTVPTPSDPASLLLSLINGARAQAGLPAYAFDPMQSSCSLAHSEHMSADGFISHDQFPADICVPYSRGAGENVAMGGGDVSWTVQQTFDEMMAEQPPADGHRENILSSTYSRVGIGIYVASNGAWITEDFTG